MDKMEESDTSAVWFAAGSFGKDIDDLYNLLDKIPFTGHDFAGRIDKKRLSIPQMTREDKILVALYSFKRLIEEKDEDKKEFQGWVVESVEKKALAFFGLGEREDWKFDRARNIYDFTVPSLRRCPQKEKILRYEHLFEPDDPLMEDFRQRKANLFNDLGTGWVSLERVKQEVLPTGST